MSQKLLIKNYNSENKTLNNNNNKIKIYGLLFLICLLVNIIVCYRHYMTLASKKVREEFLFLLVLLVYQ